MGARYGRYVTLKHLASGGMADVLLARTDGIEGFERHVVLKRIKPEHARDARFIRMFLDEARVAATLHHQNIVQVHDIGEDNGEYFIAMEYVHGEDTRKILANAARQRSHVPLAYAVAIVSAAAAGLHHAHERRGNDLQPLNIVHRDVSPSNILVGYDGSIKIVDFGIATASMRQETRSGSLKGKLSYMSPEQCKGQAVDRRTDIYALGVVLYELATTTRMIKGESDYLMMEQIVQGKIAPPQSRRPELPAELSKVIMRALATNRDQRYANVDELRIELEQFAWNAGLTTSSSSVAAYMRRQFGQRPEPWLDITQAVTGPMEVQSLDDPSSRFDGSMSGWSEQARSGSGGRARSGSLPVVQSGRIAVLSPEEAAVMRQSSSSQRLPGAPPPPTEVRSGWEAQPPAAPVVRGSSFKKLAAIGAVPIAAVAAWFAFGMTGQSPPPAALSTAVSVDRPPAAPAAAQPAPAPAAAAPAPIATTTAAATKEMTAPAPHSESTEAPEAAPSRRARTASSRPSSSETPRNKPERAARVAPSEPARSEPEPESRPVAAAPTPPAPAPVAPAPTPVPVQPAVAVAQPAAPTLVAPTTLDASRIAGSKSIAPDTITMDAIRRAGNETVVGTYKVCLTPGGEVSNVVQMKGSGYEAYDDKIRETIRKEWRYKPFIINGKPTAVCTAVRFVYSQK